MAIIQCPECQKDVSSKASTCPHCGYPLEPQETFQEPQETFQEPQETFQEPSSEIKGQSHSIAKRIIPVVLLAGIIAAVVAFAIHNANTCKASGCNNTRATGSSYCSKHTCLKSGCYNYKSASDLYCYIHDTEETSTSSSSSYESAYAVLVFSNIQVTSNSSYTICTGTVKNTGKKTYRFVEVKGAFKDSNGEVLDTDWTYAVGSEGLAPGESTTFRMSVDKNYKIRSCTVTLLDYDTN